MLWRRRAVFRALTSAAIGLLFFLQGVRLSRAAIVAGASHWRLHLVVFAATFVLFPLAGLALRPLASALLAPPMVLGLMFLCTLPSTVQSSIAFTSIAGGNVAAALCSASASSLVGMVATPLLAGLLLHAHGGFSLDALRSIAFELLPPFVAGQALQRWIGGFVQRHRKVLGMADRGSVLLMVYTVFSAATVGGIWHQLTPGLFAILAAVDAALLALMLAALPSSPAGWVFARRRDRDRVLRLEKEPRQRHPDGERAVRRAGARPHRAAADDLPPDPADGLRRARPPLRERGRGGLRGSSGARTRDNPFGCKRRSSSPRVRRAPRRPRRAGRGLALGFPPAPRGDLAGAGRHMILVTRVCVKLLTRARGPRPNCRGP